ncbi:MAG: oligoendopeptidase F [Peptostreptococcaceae bacterium]
MGIKFVKAILISLIIVTSSVCITSQAEIAEKNVLVSEFKLDDKDENEKNTKQESKIDYTKTVWNLDTLFKSDEQWKSELEVFRKDTKELKNYIGKVTKSQTHLAFALDIKEKLDIRMNKLYAYPKLKLDINKNSYKYLDMNEEAKKVYKEYMYICSNLELEILKLTDKEYDDFMKNNKINKKYGMYMNDIRRNKGHYLNDEQEQLLNSTSAIASLPSNAYDLFRNMDKKTRLTPGEYATKIESFNREERKDAYTAEFVPYNDNINVLSALLVGQVRKNIFYSSSRGYDSSLDMYLKSDDIDVKVYNSLIDTVSNNTKSLHKYMTLRKKVLNLDKVHYYDMFVPIVEPVEGNIAYDKSQTMVYSAMAPLGEEYADIIYKAFNEKWIDVYSNEKKVSGGYCLSVYDNHPYVLLNYNNSLGAVSTLSHELGHAIYEYLSCKNQNYFNSSPSIFTHEVASTTNEALLYEGLIKNARNDKEKAYYISEYLDLIKNTLYTQTMYAEFEKTIHEMVENNKNVNALVLNDIWSQLLKKYYGESYEVDPLSMVGWSRIPHFYNSFYVYKYATGCSAGITFAQSILNDNGADQYMAFLKQGGSDYPINILKNNGVNLNSTKPIQNTIKRFDDLVKELEAILEKQ